MKNLITSLLLMLSMYCFSQDKIETRLYYYTPAEVYAVFNYWDLAPTDTLKINDTMTVIMYQSPILLYPRIAYVFVNDICIAVDYSFHVKYHKDLEKQLNNNYTKFKKKWWYDDWDVITFITVKGLKNYMMLEYKPRRKNKSDYELNTKPPVDRFEIII